jgi:sugar phosphate isomerase/epimerase
MMTSDGQGGGGFKLGMFLNELQMPFDEALATAAEIGAEYVWFDHIRDGPELVDLTPAETDDLGKRVESHGLKISLLSPRSPFKFIHLTELDSDAPEDAPSVKKEMDDVVQTMKLANRLGVRDVLIYTFAWPGEYSADKPTWPMRWLTRGGVIAEVDMDKLVRIFSRVAEHGEEHDVNVVLSMMPWNYTNTTANFRQIAERVGSSRIKVMWGAADNFNCGEFDVATAGFNNVRPYLNSLHLKDVHVVDGFNLDFEYRPLGDGDIDYVTIFRSLKQHDCDVVLAAATHFVPPSGSRKEAMTINYAKLKALLNTASEAS